MWYSGRMVKKFLTVSLLFLLVAIAWYFYKKEHICTIDAAKRNRARIINTVLLAIIAAVVLYLLWLYVAVHYLGVWLGIW